MMLPEWLLALVITLVILDVFVAGEWLSWIAMIGFAVYVTWRLSPPPLWALLSFVVVFCLTVGLYYCFLRSIIQRCNSRLLMRHQRPDVLEQIAGQIGVIHIVEGKTFVKLNGELWSIFDEDSESYMEGEKVCIASIHDGRLKIRKK